MPDPSVSLSVTTRDGATARLERAREQLAALLAYGNDDERAEQARSEIAAVEAMIAAVEAAHAAQQPEPPVKPVRRGGLN